MPTCITSGTTIWWTRTICLLISSALCMAISTPLLRRPTWEGNNYSHLQLDLRTSLTAPVGPRTVLLSLQCHQDMNMCSAPSTELITHQGSVCCLFAIDKNANFLTNSTWVSPSWINTMSVHVPYCVTHVVRTLWEALASSSTFGEPSLMAFLLPTRVAW